MTEEVAMMRMGPDLLVTLHGDLDDRTVMATERRITDEVVRTRAQGALIDVSGLAVVDSFVAQVLGRLVSMVRLLGAEATIVGIRPPVAIALVELGVDLGHVHTALNAEQGLDRLRRNRVERNVRDGHDHHD